MADYDNRAMRGMTGRAEAGAAYDAGLRTFMQGVYSHMMIGLGVTGLVAYAVSHTPALMQVLFGTPLSWVVIFAPLAVVIFLSARIEQMSASTATVTFYVYSALVGLSLSAIFLMYPVGDIVRVLFITAASFGALSLYGYTTNRDLSGWGSFLFMGLIGIILASVVNIFLGSPALEFAVSIVGVLVFAGLTAYDTQRLKELYFVVGHTGETAAKVSIMGALSLYLDFINLFLFLLQLLGNREE
ncbi:MAG: Bax inhibitor-1/YccA family protein [Alphaproteobacteria bacterium]|nr:Bax inhibitor-1/YccA family protein [Alphaproteobacteria bacterium]